MKPTFTNNALKTPTYEVKQSRYNWVPALPCRIGLNSPSGGGKTTILINLLMDVYKGCFDAIFIFSHSVNIDASWTEPKKLIDAMGTGGYYDHFDENKIQTILKDHMTHVAYQKKKGFRQMHQIAVVADDLIDDPRLRYSPAFESLLIRGRHAFVSSLWTSQKMKSIPPIARINCLTS